MDNITIVRVTPEDVFALQDISRITFDETFAKDNSAENMARYIDEGFSIPRLMTELNTEGSEFYFAQKHQQTIGYLKINFGGAQTELRDDSALEIERIYVLQAYHGQKVGQLLYDKAIDIAKNNNINYIWLGVWEKNPRAIRFYEKNGFVAFDKHIFVLGDDPQIDVMMRLELIQQ